MTPAETTPVRVRPVHADQCQTPKPLAFELPPYLAARAVDGLTWLTLISSVTSVALMAINGGLQPEVADAWSHPVLRLVMVGMVLMSVGFAMVVRSGRLSKQRLLDLGMLFQVTVAFGCALLESAAHRDHEAVVLGNSGVAVWMMLCGRLMPMAPLKSAIAGALCASAWPVAYWLNVQMLGFTAMPGRRLLVRALPLIIAAAWMYALNQRVLKFYARQKRAEDAGSYALNRMIGSGGMGEVWQATHRTLARDAAVKLIRRHLLRSSTGREEQMLKARFEREARVTASLRSPHTVALFDYGQTGDGAFYYVMELLHGIDVQTMVERFGPVPAPRVVQILLQVAHSLEEAHRAGLVHRDIKPRNVMVNALGVEFDVVKVLDFGLVKDSRQTDLESALVTAEGTATGTPAYLAPEAVTGEHVVDARADLYSLGCTAYFLLTGRNVFQAASPAAYALAHIQEKPRRMSECCELPIPTEIEAIVMQLLEKDPANRIQSARELRRRLKAVPFAGEWTPEAAERWWELHLPHLASPASNATLIDSTTLTLQA